MNGSLATVAVPSYNAKIVRLATGAPPRVVDLFAGCGGLSLGFQHSGCTIVGGIEWNPEAAGTHANNFFRGRSEETIALHAHPRDIVELSPEEFMKVVLGAEDHSNAVDIIAGGPPCQAFARVGRAKLREIGKHPKAYLQDERANLYVQFLEYVDFFEPLAVLMENVPDIMNFGGQNVAHEIACSLEDLGYRVRYTILNAAHYGVPEMRQRFFLIALHGRLNRIPDFPAPSHYLRLPQGYENAQMVALSARPLPLLVEDANRYVEPPEPSEGLPKAVTAEEALGDLPPIMGHLEGRIRRGVRKFDVIAPYRSDVEPSAYVRELREWPGFESKEGVMDHVIRSLPRDYPIFARMQPGDQYPEAHTLALKMLEEALAETAAHTGVQLDSESEEYKQLKDSIVPPYDHTKFPNKWRKMEPDQPARTLTAHIGKDTYSHIHYDSAQARTISVREAARLQSFPDGFGFVGAMNSAFRQIGNAVPPLLASAIARHIRQMLTADVVNLETTQTPTSME